MLTILVLLIEILDQYIIWVYIFCLAVVLFHARAFWGARRDRVNTIYTIEREVASHREGRAMTSIGLILGLAVVVTAIKYYVIPTLDIAEIVEATPTVALIVRTREPTATLAQEPATPTARPRPTRRRIATAVPPTVTPMPLPVCPDANTCIAFPLDNATVKGRITIRGTANHGQFQFYKVEYGQGEEPTAWHVISDVHRSPVIDGVLEGFDTAALPNGVYWLKLTVVDITGNFPPPHKVRIVIEN